MTDETNEVTDEQLDAEMNAAFEGVAEQFPELWEAAQDSSYPDGRINAINEMLSLAFGEAGEADASE